MKIIDQTRNEFKKYLQPYLAVMDKPRQKVLPELIEGILSSGSCLIAESARQIDPEHLQTTERRFLRTLESPHWDESNLWITHLKQTAPFIQEDTLVTMDITDLAKPHAKKMEALATVRDGSKKELTKGYWMLSMTAALPGRKILPLTHEVFSQESNEFKSQNHILFFWAECLLYLTRRKGIFVIDRGGDGDPTFNFFLDQRADFLIRINGNRLLLNEGIPVTFSTPSRLPFNLRKTLGKRHPNISFDWQTVKLPHRKESLTLLMVRNFQDRQPIFLLTSRPVSTLKDAAFLIDAYFERWQIEESFRFLKQQLRLEKFLIRNFRAIQRLFFILCIAWGFLTRFLRLKRFQKLLEYLSFSFQKKKIKFFYYQWFRGLQYILTLFHTLLFLEVI